MDVLLGVVAEVGRAITQMLVDVESHHWVFGATAGSYIFDPHDRVVHARCDALESPWTTSGSVWPLNPCLTR